MPRRSVRVILLCEDRHQENLVAHYLKKAKLASPREIRVRKSPHGAAEQFVRENYPDELAELRRRAHQRNLRLIVVIDADVGTVENRRAQLDASCKKADVTPRRESDRVAVLIPKRNVDTWIWFLLGNDVEEDEDYKGLVKDAHCKDAAARLTEFREKGWQIPEGCPTSLGIAAAEFSAIERT